MADELPPQSVIGGERTGFRSLVKDIHKRFRLLPKASDNLDSSYAIFTQTCETPEMDLYRAEALRAEADVLEKDWGVELRGRFTSDSVQSMEDEDGSRGYVELSWNVLRDGYKANVDHARVLYKRAELVELQEKANKIIRTQRCIRYQLDQAFAGYISRVLTLKLELLEAIYPIEKRAYFKGWSHFDELVVSDSELKLARHELNYLHSSPYFDEAIQNIQNPPDIDIDMEKLVLAIRENDHVRQYSQLERDMLKQQKMAVHDNQLRFFVRNNVLQRDSFEPADVVVGVNFIVPFAQDSDKPLLNRLKVVDEKEKMQI